MSTIHVALPGYTRISRTALSRMLSAVAAEAFGLRTAQVKASVNDDGGKLAITVSLPLRVPPLEDLARDEGVLARHGGGLIGRVHTASRELAERAAELSGSEFGRIDIDLNNAIVDEARLERQAPL
ncbi:hypothetical protein FHU41_002572 [Psychromicrobium silvestre]|uniref:Uncharacterized protein n=1 Tax=Psychromicrobium silvestre TaxID=1645614 RepID=A0A7Y9S9I0_9MICC|nr:hypothetical protein [Psychromicrobium silvestre]NYE96322.1 hypothetical protein [Psychromicrobium silvestre]